VDIVAPVWPLVILSVLFSLAIPLALIVLLVVIVRNAAGGRDRYDPAAEQLRMRFARGEITQAEYEEAMRALGYQKR
jgi:uncharacterized membrane protein